MSKALFADAMAALFRPKFPPSFYRGGPDITVIKKLSLSLKQLRFLAPPPTSAVNAIHTLYSALFNKNLPYFGALSWSNEKISQEVAKAFIEKGYILRLSDPRRDGLFDLGINLIVRVNFPIEWTTSPKAISKGYAQSSHLLYQHDQHVAFWLGDPLCKPEGNLLWLPEFMEKAMENAKAKIEHAGTKPKVTKENMEMESSLETKEEKREASHDVAVVDTTARMPAQSADGSVEQKSKGASPVVTGGVDVGREGVSQQYVAQRIFLPPPSGGEPAPAVRTDDIAAHDYQWTDQQTQVHGVAEAWLRA